VDDVHTFATNIMTRINNISLGHRPLSQVITLTCFTSILQKSTCDTGTVLVNVVDISDTKWLSKVYRFQFIGMVPISQ